jgi:hypothetical protein
MALQMIENHWPRREGLAFGETFTFQDFKTAHLAIVQATMDEFFMSPHACPLPTLKSRFHYLWERGYLARTRLGWDHWEILKSGTLIEIGEQGIKAKPVETPPEPIYTGMTDEQLMAKIKEIEEEKDKAKQDDMDQAIRDLGYDI